MAASSAMRFAAGFALSSIVLGVAGCGGGGGGGGGDTFSSVLSGARVVPAVTTSNTGTFSARSRAEGPSIEFTVIHTAQNMTGAKLRGPADAGQEGPVLFDLLANGVVTRDFDPQRAGPPPIRIDAECFDDECEFIDEMRHGHVYVEIETGSHPDGELRGQIVVAIDGELDLEFTGATMTVIDGIPLEQVERDAAQVLIRSQIAEVAGIRGELGIDLSKFTFSGDDVVLTSPGAGEDSASLWTTVDPFAIKSIQVDLNLVPTISSTDTITFEVTSEAGGSQTAVVPIEIVHRGAPVLDSLIDGLIRLGGDPLPTSKIPLLRTIPVLNRLLSDGVFSGTARNQNLLLFVSPCIVDDADRAVERGVPFPCGAIAGGYVVCPVDQAADVSGPHFVLSMGLDAAVPISDPVNSYQYGFVFDVDGNPNNNYVPAPQFPEDFFQGTDRWYFVTYSPAAGWELFAVNATTPGTPQRILTDSKVVILGNVLMLIVPTGEFPIAAPPFRVTSFRHTGNFGVNGNFDVSYHPGLDDPLEPYPVPAP